MVRPTTVTREPACQTCRVRKVKCDFQKPFCKRCLDANHECGGYEKPLRFINKSATSRATTKSMQPPRTGIRILTQRHRQVQQHPNPKEQGAIIVSALTQTPASRPLERYQLVAQFVYEYCPKSRWDRLTGLPSSMTKVPHFLIEFLPQLMGNLRFFDITVASLAAAHMGTFYHDAELQNQSLQLYGQALSQAARAVGDPRLQTQDALLGTIMCLILLEGYCLPTGVTASWLTHIHGACELLKARKGDLNKGLPKGLYFNFRCIACYEAIVSRKWLFFSTPEWHEVAARFTQDSFDVLIGEMCTIPGMLEDLDRLSATKDSDRRLKMGQSLMASAVVFSRTLRQWFSSVLVAYPVPYTSVSVNDKPEYLMNLPNNPPFETCFEWESLVLAITVVHFWCACILLIEIVDGCASLTKGEQNNNEAWRDTSFAYGLLEYALSKESGSMSSLEAGCDLIADHIWQTVPYCSSEEAGIYGSNSIMFAVYIATKVYVSEKNERYRQRYAWGQALITNIMARKWRQQKGWIDLHSVRRQRQKQ